MRQDDGLRLRRVGHGAGHQVNGNNNGNTVSVGSGRIRSRDAASDLRPDRLNRAQGHSRFVRRDGHQRSTLQGWGARAILQSCPCGSPVTHRKDGPVAQRSYIGALADICDDPSFNVGDSIMPLRDAASTFRSWLETTITIPKMWLSTLSVELEIRIRRVDLLKISGN